MQCCYMKRRGYFIIHKLPDTNTTADPGATGELALLLSTGSHCWGCRSSHTFTCQCQTTPYQPKELRAICTSLPKTLHNCFSLNSCLEIIQTARINWHSTLDFQIRLDLRCWKKEHELTSQHCHTIDELPCQVWCMRKIHCTCLLHAGLVQTQNAVIEGLTTTTRYCIFNRVMLLQWVGTSITPRVTWCCFVFPSFILNMTQWWRFILCLMLRPSWQNWNTWCLI